MAIIEKKTIISPEAEKPFNVLLAEFDKVIKVEKELLAVSKALTDSYLELKKTNDGKEAKSLVIINNELIKTNNALIKNEKDLIDIKIKKERLEQAELRTQKLRNTQLKEETNAYKALTKATNEAQMNFKKLAVEFGINSKQAQKARNEFYKLDNQLRSVNQAARDGRRDVGRYGAALKNFALNITGALGITVGIQALVNVMQNAFGIIKEFSKRISELSAITGASGKDLDFLRDKAKELAAQYGRSASDIVEAMKLVGSAKPELLSNVQALSDMTEAVLILSQASGMDLSSATSNLAVIMNQFGMTAAQANEAINILAAGSKFGSVEVDFLAQAISKVGTVASSAGLSLEQVTAVMELFGEKGIQAEIAGTGFKAVLVKLQADTKNYTNGVFDLNKAIDNNVGISNNNLELQKRFGKEYFNLAQILLQNKDRFMQLTQQVTGTNTAFEQAAIATDNLTGDLDKAKGAWDSFVLSFEDGGGIVGEVIRKIIQGFSAFLKLVSIMNSKDAGVKFMKEFGGLQDEINRKLNIQAQVIKKLGDTKAKDVFISKELLKNSQNLAVAEYKLQVGRENGAELSDIRRSQLEMEAELYKQLINQLNGYKSGVVQANTQDEKNIKITNKKTAALEKYNTERAKELEMMGAKGGVSNTAELIANENLVILQGKQTVSEGSIDILKKQLETEAELKRKAYEDELEQTKLIEDKKKEIREQAEEQAIDFASAVYSNYQDNKLNELKDQNEAEKEILKDKLDKGLISEEQYNQKIKEINKKERIEEAKSEKKKAIFDIAINTAVAAIKALPNFILSALVVAQGAIQAAFVAAKPIPKFAKGEINIKGKSHKEGGIMAEIEGGESVITKKGTANAPETLDLINKGLLSDSDVMSKNISLEYLIISQLRKNNKINERMLTAISNGVYEYEDGGYKHVIFANGSRTIKRPVR